jgi:hypothetical protein
MLLKNDSPSTSRALVPLVAEPETAHRHRPVQRTSSFVAQLIASTSRAPQARQRRRAEAAEVIAAYRETVDRIQRLSTKVA